MSIRANYTNKEQTNYYRLMTKNYNSLDPQNVGPDLDPNSLTPRWYSWNNFSQVLELNFKKSADDNNMQNYLY